MWLNKKLLAIFFVGSIQMIEVSLAQNSAEDYVDAHNKVREQVGVGPITWNDTVAAYAQEYANSRIEKCEFEHSMGPYGENIAMGYGDLKGTDAVAMWAGEKPHYDPNSNTCVGDECLHYTQIVWKTSHHLGCARSHCKNGWVFVTCNYDPPGNIEGFRPY